MPDKQPWEEDWGAESAGPAPWEEDWSGDSAAAEPASPIKPNRVRDAMLAEKKRRGVDRLGGTVTPDELAAATPETRLATPNTDIPYARASGVDEKPGIIDRLLAGADTSEKVLETAQRWNLPNNIFESGRKALAPLRAASNPMPEETPTVADVATILGGSGAIPPVRDLLEKYVGPALNPTIAKVFGAATSATQPIRDAIAPTENESTLKAAAMFPVRAYAQARDVLGLDPANAVLAGGTAGMGAIAKGVQAASEGAFLADMLHSIPQSMESLADAGVNKGAAGALQALPEAAVPVVMAGMLGRGMAGHAARGAESYRDFAGTRKTEKLLQENYQSAVRKISQNEKASDPRLKGLDENELAAYFAGNEEGNVLRRTQNVDELEAVAREMFTGRPETKVVIHETWDSVPKEMHPKNAAAKETIPSLIDNANDTIHVIRNAPNKAGADLMTNVRHERGHSVDDFKPEEVTDALADKMRERLPQMMNEHGVPAGEVNRLLSLDQPGFIAEMKRMATDETTAQIPTLLAQEAVATLMQEYRADPSKVGLFMAKAARKIPGVQMTANDIRAIMAERMGARGKGPAKIEMVGEKPAEVMPQPKPAEAPALKKGDTVYLPSSQPAIRLYDTGKITSIGKDGKVRVVVNGKGGKAGDRFVELAQDQVSLEPPAVARESVPTPDQIAERQRMADIARQQRQNAAEVEAGRGFVEEAADRQRPLIDKVVEQPVGPEARRLEPGADVRPGLLEEIINPAEGTPNDPFLLRAPAGGKLRAAASKPPKATVDPLLPADEAPYPSRHLNYQNVGEYAFKPAKINPEMKPDEWRAHAEQQMEYLGVSRTRPPETDPRGFHLKDMGDDGKVVTLYDGDNIATSARIDKDGGVLWLWSAKDSFKPQKSPYWRDGDDSVSKLGRWLALRDDARPYVRIQRELARQGTRRTGDELYTDKGARAIDETLIPPTQAVTVIDGFRDRPRLVAQATGMHAAYVEKGIADLVGGRYDSPEAMDVVQWAHGELRRAYEREILGARELHDGRSGDVPARVPDGDSQGILGRPAGAGVADAVGDGRTGTEVAPFPEALRPAFQNVAGRGEASRANKNLLDPIRGDVIRFGASLVDEHGTPESFISKMSEGLEGSAKLEMQRMASDVFDDVKAFRAGQIEVDSVLKQMEAGVKPKGDLGKPAEGKARDLLDAVDAAREREDIPHRRKDSQVEKEAIKLRAKLGRQGVINLAVDVAKQMTLPKGVKNAITGNLRMLSDVETLAVRMEMNDLDAMGAGWNDPKKALENVLLANAYRTTGSDPARSMRMRRWDIGMTNPERVRSVLFDMAYDPSSRNAAALADSNSAFHKASVRQMEKQLQRARDFLKDETGYDRIEDIPDALLLDKTYMKNIVDRWSAKIAPMSAKARTWYLNSILSAPKTHVANMTGNTLNFVTEYYGHRRLEALINDLLDKTGAGKDVSGVRSSDLSGLMSQLISIENSAFKQAMALEGSQLKIDGGLVGQASKDAKQFFKTREAQLRRRVEGEDWIGELREKKQSFSGTPGKIITAPSRALGMADEFGKSLMGHMEALVSARQIAREMGHKVNSPEYNAEVHKQLADYDSAAWHKALERSEYLAFQSEHRKIVKSLLALRHAHPQLSFVVPFITTPVNLFARAFEFVPGLGIRFRGDVGLTKGNYKGKEIPGEKNAGDYKSRMIAAQLIGSAATVMLGTLGLDAFKEGEDEPWITGSEPPSKFSKGEREARQRSLQPYTIKNPFGEGRVSYKRLDPLSTTAAVTVDFVHALRDWNTHGDITRAAAIMKQSILGQAVGKTFLQTPGEIVQWLQDKPGSDPLGPVKTIAAGFYPNLFRAATQAFFDDVVREQRQYGAKEGEPGQNPTERLAKTFGYRLLGAPSLPGVGDLVEPKVTAYGEEVKRGGAAPYRFISPFDIYPGGSPDTRTMDLRFLRGIESLPDAEDSLPTEMQPKVRFGGKTIALTPEDWAAAEKARGGLYLDVLKNAGFTKDRQKPLEAWELEAIKKINEKTSKMAHPYAAKYFGGK